MKIRFLLLSIAISFLLISCQNKEIAEYTEQGIYYLKKEDFVQLFKFIVALIPSAIYKVYLLISHRKIWLICEAPDEARDNGYCFFKYLTKNKLDKDCFYAIHSDSADFKKVKRLGKTVEYGSIFHWVLYLCSQYNISTQKSGRPGVAVGYILEKLHLVKSKTVFLQHGITINKATWLFYNNTYMKLFICGAKPEYDYVKKYFGYPKDAVKFFIQGELPMIDTKGKISVFEDATNFKNTEYFKKYQSLITNRRLISFLENNNLKLFFYPHRNMQQFIDSFKTISKNVVIARSDKYDIRKLLITSSLMITDYSSVALDFAYMKKPVIYYQFDIERFRKKK